MAYHQALPGRKAAYSANTRTKVDQKAGANDCVANSHPSPALELPPVTDAKSAVKVGVSYQIKKSEGKMTAGDSN